MQRRSSFGRARSDIADCLCCLLEWMNDWLAGWLLNVQISRYEHSSGYLCTGSTRTVRMYVWSRYFAYLPFFVFFFFSSCFFYLLCYPGFMHLVLSLSVLLSAHSLHFPAWGHCGWGVVDEWGGMHTLAAQNWHVCTWPNRNDDDQKAWILFYK